MRGTGNEIKRNGRAAGPVLRLDGEAATSALASALAPALRPGDVIALRGDLGTGKTTLARALIRAAGDAGQEVPSPTFTLVQAYPSRLGGGVPIYHFDLYRIDDAEEAFELGLEEALADGISLIEWPERLGALLPDTRLDILLHFAEQAEVRIAALRGHGGWARRLEDLRLEDLRLGDTGLG
jgi:tRNA threonylcarbamoyladenosine biosynthesis protein TsaE